MPLFDTYVMVDWSARSEKSRKKPKKDAIWWAVHPLGDARPWFTELGRKKRVDCHDSVSYLGAGVQVYEQTRHMAIENIQEFLLQIAKKRRVLVGFDFAFGYPTGFAEAITGKPCALELWSALSVSGHSKNDKIVISDKEDNKNNRFAVAAELNKRVKPKEQPGPFWGHPIKSAQQHLGVKYGNPYSHGEAWPFGFEMLRETEKRASGTKTVWQLLGNGSVGSQVLLGIPALHKLRTTLGPACTVWPFDTGFSIPRKGDGPRIVIVEIYPSLLGKKKDIEPWMYAVDDREEILDQAQVRLNAEAFSLLDARGGLEKLFRIPEKDRGVQKEEGWIFGIPYKGEICGVLREEYARDGHRGGSVVQA